MIFFEVKALKKSSQGSLENYHLSNGVPGGIRTPDLQVRSLPFYPAKLRVRIKCAFGMKFILRKFSIKNRLNNF